MSPQSICYEETKESLLSFSNRVSVTLGLFPGSSLDVIILHASSDPITLLIKMDLGNHGKD